ncbi:MAG: hypothetical protein R3B64_02730 [Candidatus Paceibacterota bacterium]
MRKESIFIPSQVTFLLFFLYVASVIGATWGMNNDWVHTVVILITLFWGLMGFRTFEPELGTNLLIFGVFSPFCVKGGLVWLPLYPIVGYKKMHKDESGVVSFGTQAPLNMFFIHKEIKLFCKDKVYVYGEKPITYAVTVYDLAKFIQYARDTNKLIDFVAGRTIETKAKEVGHANTSISIMQDDTLYLQRADGSKVPIDSLEEYVFQTFEQNYPGGHIEIIGLDVNEIDFPDMVGSEAYMKGLEESAIVLNTEDMKNQAKDVRLRGSLKRMDKMKKNMGDLTQKQVMQYVGASDDIYDEHASVSDKNININVAANEEAVDLGKDLVGGLSAIVDLLRKK